MSKASNSVAGMLVLGNFLLLLKGFELGKEASSAFFAQAIAMAANVEGGGEVEEAVENGGSQHLVGEDVAPFAEGLIGSKNDAALLITTRDQLKEELGGHAVEGEVADFVQDEEFGFAQGVQTMTETVFLGITMQHLEQIDHGEEVDAVSLQDGGHAQGDGEVGFSASIEMPS